MSEWKVIQTPESKLEIRSIYSYIANVLLVPETATKQTKRIVKEIKNLANMPSKFSLYDKEPWHSRGLRKMPVDNYVVFYWVHDDTREVVIFHVFYGGSNIDDALNKELMQKDNLL